ncbi:N-methyl-L-tryptophan oxidase [Amycolatopsis pithecellobii]|uniref:N-methyl-L-tryptophan oxidase n=1 Tax=Amycolatopsis pithecellobii TaxID=664692 RepID=A0A6N7Z3C8_9PSEU|nr:N-methyl-L-tryptophan oxidase [Amycolatopsis pithecellobii]MTD55599.1 N-methyl-L-tryptophan oxidase [Amycolatopsis pithecellobii]
MQVRETDVVIIGAGSVGSMAAWQLARRGVSVIALDRFSIPGPLSAYAGESRLFRKVYKEGGHYTPLLQRAQELWRELEAEGGVELLAMTGGVTIAGEGHPDLEALLDASESYGLKHEVLDGDVARRRFPGHHILDTDTVFFDPEAGYLRSEKAVVTALKLAAASGATFLGNRKALAVEPQGDRWIVRTGQESVVAQKVIVSAGTGASIVTQSLGTHLALRPQVLTWFPMARENAYSAPDSPIFIRRSKDAEFYGFPSADGWTVKVAASVYLDEVESMERPPSWEPAHLETIRRWVGTYLPDLIPDPIRTQLCADGYLVDSTGLLGEIPGMPGTVAAVGFSGHGFKMAPAFGAVAADLVISGATSTDVSFMSPARFLDEGQTLDTLLLA